MRLIISLMVLSLVAAGCGDDGSDDVEQEADDLEQEAEETVDEAGARAAAEAVRVQLEAEDLEDDASLRDVAVLQDATGDLPGDPEVTGLEDADGDGRDDDGLVELHVGDERACVSISGDDDAVDVHGGAC